MMILMICDEWAHLTIGTTRLIEDDINLKVRYTKSSLRADDGLLR